jgi:hypothetical protein
MVIAVEKLSAGARNCSGPTNCGATDFHDSVAAQRIVRPLIFMVREVRIGRKHINEVKYVDVS